MITLYDTKKTDTLYDTKKTGSIVLTVGTGNSDNSNTQRKQKIVRIIKCLIYQKLTRKTPGFLPVTVGRHKKWLKITK